MTPERIVTSLALSKKLKAAGWKVGDSFFSREGYMLGDDGEPQNWILCHGHVPERNDKYVLPSPTAAELLERLPIGTIIDKATNTYRCYIPHVREGRPFSADTASDAAASMYLFLSSHNLLPSS